MMARSAPRLIVAWMTVAAALLAGPAIGHVADVPGIAIFMVLLGVILWSAFGVVHEAEELARRLGEPRGTLILTLSVVVIEVALISAVMIDARSVPTLGRDTMFAVLMIVLNGVVGLGLLIGGLRHGQQCYNLQGAGAYLAIIIPLTVIGLVLPNFTTSSPGGTLSLLQAVFFSLFTVALYAIFLWLQTGRHRGFFTASDEDDPAESALPQATGAFGSVWLRTALLLANLMPIVILSKSLAKLLDRGLAALHAPTALGGILIAMIVFTPEGISALRAAAANRLTRAINLALGSAASTLGLTVPAVLAVGLVTGQPVVLGVSAVNMVLLAVTLVLATLTFSSQRTTMLEGAVHLTLFFAFVVLVFSP